MQTGPLEGKLTQNTVYLSIKLLIKNVVLINTFSPQTYAKMTTSSPKSNTKSQDWWSSNSAFLDPAGTFEVCYPSLANTFVAHD